MKILPAIGALACLLSGAAFHIHSAEQPPPTWVVNLGTELGVTSSGGSSSIATSSEGTLYLAIGSSSQAIQGSAGVLVPIGLDGSTSWLYKVPRGAMNHGPVVAGDGTIYFTATIYQQNPPVITGTLFAINPQGQQDWKFERPRSLGSPAIASDGSIWVTSHTNLFALEPDGEVRHQIDSSSSSVVFTDFIAIAADDTVYAGTGQGSVIAYNPDGTVRWQFASPVMPRLRPAIGSDGTIYISDGASREIWGGRLLALNRDGSLQWEYPTGSPIIASPVVGSDGSVYVVTEDGEVLAIDANGTLRWSFSSGVPLRVSPVIGEDENLYFPGTGTTFFTLSSEGEPVSETEVSAVSVPPVLTAEGRFYFLQGFNLVAHDLETTPASSSWPMSGADSAQTSRSAISPPDPVGNLPQITEAFLPTEVPAGEELTLSVAASSDEALSFQWRRNGQPIPGATSDSLHLSVVTLLDAGEYSVSVSNSAGTVSTPLTRVTVLPAPPGLLFPIALTGWNLDVVREAAEPHTAHAFSDLPPGTSLEAIHGSSWFESGYQNQDDGLPSTRRVFSALDAGTFFEFQPYTGDNVLKLNTSTPTGTLTLAEPAAYRYLAILAASTLSGGGIGEVVLHFDDETTSDPLPLYAPEWNTLDPLLAFGDVSAVSHPAPESFNVYRDFEHGFGLFQTDLDLGALGLQEKVLTALTFTKPGGAGRPYITGVFAVSGLQFRENPVLGVPVPVGNGKFQVPLAGVTGDFVVERSLDLTAWENAPEVTVLPSGELEIDPENDHGFYRVVVPLFQP